MMNYYNFSYEYIEELTMQDFNFFYECMQKAKANDRLQDLDLHIYPHLKQETARKMHKKLVSEAQTKEEKNKVVTFADLKSKGFEGLSREI